MSEKERNIDGFTVICVLTIISVFLAVMIAAASKWDEVRRSYETKATTVTEETFVDEDGKPRTRKTTVEEPTVLRLKETKP